MKRLTYEHGKDLILCMTKDSKFEVTRDENNKVVVKMFSSIDSTQELGVVELQEFQNILFTTHETK